MFSGSDSDEHASQDDNSEAFIDGEDLDDDNAQEDVDDGVRTESSTCLGEAAGAPTTAADTLPTSEAMFSPGWAADLPAGQRVKPQLFHPGMLPATGLSILKTCVDALIIEVSSRTFENWTLRFEYYVSAVSGKRRPEPQFKGMWHESSNAFNHIIFTSPYVVYIREKDVKKYRDTVNGLLTSVRLTPHPSQPHMISHGKYHLSSPEVAAVLDAAGIESVVLEGFGDQSSLDTFKRLLADLRFFPNQRPSANKLRFAIDVARDFAPIVPNHFSLFSMLATDDVGQPVAPQHDASASDTLTQPNRRQRQSKSKSKSKSRKDDPPPPEWTVRKRAVAAVMANGRKVTGEVYPMFAPVAGLSHGGVQIPVWVRMTLGNCGKLPPPPFSPTQTLPFLRRHAQQNCNPLFCMPRCTHSLSTA